MRDFAKSWAAYKADLEARLGREPTREEVMAEMMKFGWEFEDSSGPLTENDLR